MSATSVATGPRRAVPRAEPVGSLLRAPEIVEQIGRTYGDATTASQPLVLRDKPLELGRLNEIADRAVAENVRRQVEAGLDVITDGEVRRVTFLSSFYDSVEGMGHAERPFEVHDEDGNVVYTGYADPVVKDRLRKAYAPVATEVAYLRSVTEAPFKITVPAPSYFYSHFVGLEGSVYDNRRDLVADAIEAEKGILAEAVAAGARWVQFDFPLYPGLVDDAYVEGLVRDVGVSADELLDLAIAADRGVAEDIPDDVTVAMHLCRGNFEGGFWNGSLESVAERMFNDLPHQRFLCEWEDVAREGDYAPIRHVPKGKVVGMGLVSTKTPEVERDDDVVRRLEEAATHLDVEQLALCPQCGFASLYGDHLVQAQDAQWRKLELIGRVADRVWGTA